MVKRVGTGGGFADPLTLQILRRTGTGLGGGEDGEVVGKSGGEGNGVSISAGGGTGEGGGGGGGGKEKK